MQDLKIFIKAYSKVVIGIAIFVGLLFIGWWTSEDIDKYPYELFRQFETVGVDSSGKDIKYWEVTETAPYNRALPDTSYSYSSVADSTAYKIPGTNTWIYNKPNPRMQIFWNTETKKFELSNGQSIRKK